MLLEAFITTVPTPTERPVKVADLGFRPGAKVTIPWGDSRLCDGIELDMHDPATHKLFQYDGGGLVVRDKTLALALKIYYRQKVVFHGPIHAPEFDYATGKILLSAHDPTLRLKHTYIHSGEPPAGGVTLDGEGLLAILDAAQNFTAEDTAGDPVLGIIPGRDTTTDSDTTRKINVGDESYQSMLDITGLVTGPDMNFVPVETDPAELASGSDFANYVGGAATIADNATTDFSLPITFPGTIGGLKLGVWIEHTKPGEVNIDLVHPDGSAARIYTGSKESTPLSGSGDFLGQGTGSDLCYFQISHPKPYGTAYPHVGVFRPDRSLNGFLGKTAVGTWKLRVHDTAASHTGTVKHFHLQFTLPPPAYVRMDTSDKPDSAALPDPTCTFMKGHGPDNARILKVSPQGDLTRNYFTAASKGVKKVRKSDAARLLYGRYEGYEAAGQNDTAAVLAAYADNEILAYSYPLPAIELAPKDDGGINDTLRYGEDFFEGSYVMAVGKKGYSFHALLARVMKVTLTNAADQNGSAVVRTDMDVIPAIALTSELADA